MPVVISLLRGVNVLGKNKIRMEELRALYESLGLRNPQTFIQSGNILFKTEEKDLTPIAHRIGEAIEKTFGFRPAVILRTASELRNVIKRNPFAARQDIDPSRFLVSFLAGLPDAKSRELVQAMNVEPDELRIEARELYIYFPNGQGRSKLPMSRIERTLHTFGTGRNWNTVTKLLNLAEKL